MFLKLAFLLVLGVACQKAYADEPESVVGGTNAGPGEIPYQASLRVNGAHVCGGSIGSDSHIITAAHCIVGVVNAPWGNFAIVTGSHLLNSGGQTHLVRDVRVHPEYINSGRYSWVNDAAIIYLRQPMKFNAYQKSIPLATSEPAVNDRLLLSGWGTTRNGGNIPNNLQKATVYYVPPQLCQQTHPGMTIYETHMCALNRPGVGACHGDSGGPLVHNGKLAGIASWVVPCAEGVPDVYTRVSKYSAFFREVRNALN